MQRCTSGYVKQETKDLNDAVASIGNYLGWKDSREEYFPDTNQAKPTRKGSHQADVTLQKEINGNIVTVRVNTTTDNALNNPDKRERRNAEALDQKITARNIKDGQADSLNQIVTISKTDGKINNVDYTNITQHVDPFNQKFNDPDVAREMQQLHSELDNLGKERANGKTAAQVANEYNKKKEEKDKQDNNGCKDS